MYPSASLLLAVFAVLPASLGATCGAGKGKPSAGSSSVAPAVPTSSAGSPAASSVPVPASKISLDSTFIYELDHPSVGTPNVMSAAGVSMDANVYIIDMETTSPEQIAQYKADGKTVMCYFVAGTWDPNRSDAMAFDPPCVCDGAELSETACSTSDNKQLNWNQWWLDIHSPSCRANVENVMETRIKTAKSKGCDGIDPDNVDSYINTHEQKHGNTEDDQFDYLMWLSTTARANGLLIDLKNANGMLRGDHKDDIVAAFDFSVIESCHVYNECDVYTAFIDAGKPNFQIEYGAMDTCPTLQKGQHLLVYSENTLDTSKITKMC